MVQGLRTMQSLAFTCNAVEWTAIPSSLSLYIPVKMKKTVWRRWGELLLLLLLLHDEIKSTDADTVVGNNNTIK